MLVLRTMLVLGAMRCAIFMSVVTLGLHRVCGGRGQALVVDLSITQLTQRRLHAGEDEGEQHEQSGQTLEHDFGVRRSTAK